MEIDIEYEVTRDLFEKQRVIDNYLEEHQEDNEVLHSYYNNHYSVSKLNNHVKYIYDNTFELEKIKFGIWSGMLSTGVMTGCLYAIHPYLTILSLPDWTLLFGFCGFYANNTVNRIILDKDKQTVQINKLNFLGAMTAKCDYALVRDIQYMGEYKNEWMSFDYFGLPPTLMKLLTMNLSKLEKDPVTGDARSESVPEEDKNTFKHFSSFMIDN